MRLTAAIFGPNLMSNLKHRDNPVAELIFVKMMLLFDVNRIYIKRMDEKCIEAIVGWPDQGQAHYNEEEEQQEVAWNYQEVPLNPDVSLVMELLKSESLLRGDRIERAEHALQEQLSETFSWSENRSRRAIEALLSLRVDMVDDGEKSDAFFIHF